ncbi:MAG TPA: sigma-70 family RNA polymerase sigma factor [Verrucomicrobiales bacterium]|nr:sigma-70 family RNA polymerase sigma factor [Verrucomicrobiales bacterium]
MATDHSGPPERSPGERLRPARNFPNTRWSLVLRAREDHESASGALASLCEDYWYPLYAFVRRDGWSPEDAEDLTQDFFQAVLEKDVFGHADQERGRLRNYLLAALKHFLLNARRRERTIKRGGGTRPLPLDHAWAEERLAAEPVDPSDPEILYDRLWARRMLERTLADLRTSYDSLGSAKQFEVLRPFLGGTEPDGSYGRAAARLGVSENAVKVAVHRLRRRFREHLHRHVADTLAGNSEEEIRAEILHLLRSLG